MPGLDYDVHELTRAGERYGCNGPSKRKPGYWAPDICRKTSPPKVVWAWIEDTSSTECRFDLSLKDGRCDGCPRRGSGEEYDQRIRRMGT